MSGCLNTEKLLIHMYLAKIFSGLYYYTFPTTKFKVNNDNKLGLGLVPIFPIQINYTLKRTVRKVAKLPTGPDQKPVIKIY